MFTSESWFDYQFKNDQDYACNLKIPVFVIIGVGDVPSKPYEIFIVATEEVAAFDCTVFPNPTSSYLVLRMVNYPTLDMSYQLFDGHGRLLLANELQGAETSIPTKSLASATYFLSFVKHGEKVKSFKIIKN